MALPDAYRAPHVELIGRNQVACGMRPLETFRDVANAVGSEAWWIQPVDAASARLTVRG